MDYINVEIICKIFYYNEVYEIGKYWRMLLFIFFFKLKINIIFIYIYVVIFYYIFIYIFVIFLIRLVIGIFFI